MSIKTGIYIISNKANNHSIGRYPVEDLSMQPKHVLVLPQGIQAPQWIIEKKEGTDTYTMKAGHAATAVQDGLLWVTLMDDTPPPAASWSITATPQHGENTYIIQLAGNGAGWVVPDTNPDGRDLVRAFYCFVSPAE
ncbi:hypothetical protein FRB94_008552 [Tulasnella sp. JGI-2019a]|nr:hypothetical protein FRB94_008552 [Tulasnella sp. JGI-2019a]KAG9010623.1 hypothetical protein FRB93_003891 [Tulasnella sp. JGI-2019a]